MNTFRVLFAASVVLVPSTCLAQLAWDFNASNATSKWLVCRRARWKLEDCGIAARGRWRKRAARHGGSGLAVSCLWR